MQFAQFIGRDKQPVFANPRLVTFVRQVNDKHSVIYFSVDYTVEVEMDAHSVVQELLKAGDWSPAASASKPSGA